MFDATYRGICTAVHRSMLSEYPDPPLQGTEDVIVGMGLGVCLQHCQ